MHISTEGKIGIALGLVALLGAGAIVVWPEHTEIGWAMMAIAAVGGLALAVHHFGEAWSATAKVVAVIGGIAFLALTGLLIWFFRPNTVVLPKQDLSPPVPLLAEQVQELKAIDNFVGAPDEGSLRDTFDLPRMARMNILVAQDWAIKNSKEKQRYLLAKAKSKAMDAFAKRATISIDNRLLTISPPAPGSIVRHAQLSADYFCCLYRSPEHIAALQRLRRYEASATLPNDVRAALVQFDSTVDLDAGLIPTVINEYYLRNHDLLIHDDDQKSLYFGQVTAAYWNRIIPLRPRAAEISTAIRRYLKVN